MTYTRKIVFLSVFQAAILGCNAKLTPGQPRGPLPWGDINILHTSDTHGWLLGHTKNQWPEPNYSGTYGDFISFVGHMKKLAEEKDVDLLLVDSGDLHDGSGLTDGYPKGGINGEEAIKSFLKVPYDVMAIGNHELYVTDVTLDIYNNFAPKLDGRYLSSNSYLTTTFKNGSSVEHIIGSRYRRFKTLRGRQVTSLGVIFDFKEHNINTTIHNPGKMVAEAWFQELMLQPTDIFVLTGHMSALQGDWAIVTNAIRKHHPTTPIAALGGHAHIRFCHQFDSNTMLLESGRFMETVGWMGISLNKTYPESPASFERRYLDANRITYMYHSNTTEQNFDSEVGIEVDLFNQKLTARWNLGKVHGCASQDYFVERYPWPHPQNLYAFYIFQVLPEVLVKTSGRADKPYVTLVNNGMLRFDIYRGTFTWNDQLTVLPFKEGYLYIEVPWSIAQNIKDKLYEYPKDHLNAARILTEKFGSTVDATLPEHLAQALLSAPSNLSPGYVTEDDCGGNGDDTEHIPTPRSNNPDYMSNDPFYPIPHNASVDFIMPVFLGKRVLEAINRLGHPATWEDMHQYGNVTSKEVFAKYFEHFPAINNECPRVFIEKWFDDGHNTCPATEMKLPNLSLVPNTDTRSLISKWCKEKGIDLAESIPQPSTFGSLETSNNSFSSCGSLAGLNLQIDLSNVSLGSIDTSFNSGLSRDSSLDLKYFSSTHEIETELLCNISQLPWESQYMAIEDTQNYLDCNSHSRVPLSSKNFMEPVIGFLKASADKQDTRAQIAGSRLILTAIRASRNAIKCMNEDAYALLASFLGTVITKEVLAIFELSVEKSSASKLAQSDALTSIIQILDTEYKEFHKTAINILYNLSLADDSCLQKFLPGICIPRLVPFLKESSYAGQCIVIMEKLIYTEEARILAVKTEGCIAAIVELLETGNCDEQEHALSILMSLCSQYEQCCKLAMMEGIIPSLFGIAVNGNDKGKVIASELLRLLRDIAHEDEHEDSVYDDDELVCKLPYSETNKVPLKRNRFFSKFTSKLKKR